MARIRNQEEFIAKANEIYDGRYDYSLVKYTKSSEKVIIICPDHGSFEKTPNKHLAGQGCPVCGRNRTKIGLDEFLSRAHAIHGSRYDYSKTTYHRIDEPVEIICKIHGSFMQTPQPWAEFNFMVTADGCGTNGKRLVSDDRNFYRNLMNAILGFFSSGVSPVPREETLEIVSVIGTARVARTHPDEWFAVPH